jgi:hypothetical protein
MRWWMDSCELSSTLPSAARTTRAPVRSTRSTNKRLISHLEQVDITTQPAQGVELMVEPMAERVVMVVVVVVPSS